MENPESQDKEQTIQKPKPPEKPIRKRNQGKSHQKVQARTPKPTPTAILCELTRLKAQQKYLECNQVKLNPKNFMLEDEEDIHRADPETELDGERPSSSSTAALIRQINAIEVEKLDLNEKLKKYKKIKRDELQDMWHYVATIREDVFQPERLSQYTINALREKIIAVSGQLERLGEKNAKELETLRKDYELLERENKVLWKGSM
ncbi:uncharacterized protein Dana_GF27993 [Drosophila ananassae]|uniref:Uncharacterized protein n=1 Tax=Drosophila ananassae TaxID=7217 RepID=A0A0P8YA79_DROAN|nr:uncharacterized protein LOC26515402 [Drosophila ananassae]KPU76010.1 uncharacterized protein Dana_GF27993 [Drosophila ananassae]